MSRPDSTASDALDERVVKPIYFAFLDFLNEPVRANSSGRSIVIASSGIPDLDGDYLGINNRFVTIGEIKQSEDGNDSVECSIAASFKWDEEMLEEISDPANWQGRIVRLWRLIRNAANVNQGGYQHYYTGYMTDLVVNASKDDQKIRLTIEGYVSAFSRASGLTWLDQALFDADDRSPDAAIAIGNNSSGGNPGGNVFRPGGGGGGYGRDLSGNIVAER